MSLSQEVFLFSWTVWMVCMPSVFGTTTRTQTATLTSANLQSPIAEVSLIQTDGKTTHNDIAGDGAFRSDGGNVRVTDSFAVELDIYNQECQGIETIEIKVYGGVASGDVDLITMISNLNSNGEYNYISFLNDWDGLTSTIGKKNAAGNGVTGGVFIAPYCDSNSLFNTNDFNWVNNILSNTNGDLWAHRDAMTDGDSSNFQRLTSSRVNSNSPVIYNIVNNQIDGTMTVSYAASGSGLGWLECNYNTYFDTFNNGNGYKIAFGTDHDRVKFDQFEVTVTCEMDTQEPTVVPTVQPSVQPTSMPTRECTSTSARDVVFALDYSNSVNDADLEKQKDFVQDLLLTGISSQSNVGIVAFAREVVEIYSLGAAQDNRQLIANAVESSVRVQPNGNTWTDSAIKRSVNMYNQFGTNDGILFLITDGKPVPNSEDPCIAANQETLNDLTASGLEVVILAVGNFDSTSLLCLVESDDQIISVNDFDQADLDSIREKTDAFLCPAKECSYTHTCQVSGDPHTWTFDGLLHHFQGEGWFDYVKACDDNVLLPFTISARHEECRSTRTCVDEVLVTLEDGSNTQISFPTDGMPTYKNGNNVGSSAIGTYGFADLINGELVEYTATKYNFEISFVDQNGDNVMLKFYYKGRLLKIETSDCLSGDLGLCGLCGNINDDTTDDFRKCNDVDYTVDTTGVSSITTGDPWINTHEFGESCCRRDLDDLYIMTPGYVSDCGNVIEPPPTINPQCISSAQEICRSFYNTKCKSCDSDLDATDEWIYSCAFDLCADNNCQSYVLDDNLLFGVDEAISSSCLVNSVEDCFDSLYLDLFEQFKALGYTV